jgi:hypothetical protein
MYTKMERIILLLNVLEIPKTTNKNKLFIKIFFLIRIVGGGVQAGSTRDVGH